MSTLPGYEKFCRQKLGKMEKKEKAYNFAERDEQAMGEAVIGDEAAPPKYAFLAKAKRGRKTNGDFERDVMGRLVITVVVDANKEAKKDPEVKKNAAKREEVFAHIVANCFYSYGIARAAAQATQSSPKWKDDPSVKNLKFSDQWIKSFIDRFNFSRLAITSKMKTDRPSPEEVQTIMAWIQGKIKHFGLELCDLFNMDETPGIWGINPRHGYGPQGERLAGPSNDDRSRMTIIVTVSADGTVLPPQFIIKCSTELADQSNIHVINSLLKNPDFNKDNLWTMHTWSRKLLIRDNKYKDKKKMKEVTFTRPYLKHPDGRVVWAHPKAYMDSPGLAMYADLVMGPARVSSGRPKWGLVWDNCPSHLVESVRAVFAEHNIELFELPINMTDYLQPVDLVPNGPIKAHVKSARGRALYMYMQLYNTDYQEALSNTDDKGNPAPLPPPKYSPPVPTMAQGISIVSEIFAGPFQAESFQASVRSCFEAVGLAPCNAEGKYKCVLCTLPL